MDCKTGRIYDGGVIDMLIAGGADQKRYKPMAIPPTPRQRARQRVGRNDPCPCGSGVKFKHCCLRK